MEYLSHTGLANYVYIILVEAHSDVDTLGKYMQKRKNRMIGDLYNPKMIPEVHFNANVPYVQPNRVKRSSEGKGSRMSSTCIRETALT